MTLQNREFNKKGTQSHDYQMSVRNQPGLPPISSQMQAGQFSNVQTSRDYNQKLQNLQQELFNHM